MKLTTIRNMVVALLPCCIWAAKYKDFKFPDGYIVAANTFEKCDAGHYFSCRIIAQQFLKFNMADRAIAYATKTCEARTLECRSEGEALIKAGQIAAGEKLMRMGCDGDVMVACGKFAEYLIAAGRTREAYEPLDKECSVRGLKCTQSASLHLGRELTHDEYMSISEEGMRRYRNYQAYIEPLERERDEQQKNIGQVAANAIGSRPSGLSQLNGALQQINANLGSGKSVIRSSAAPVKGSGSCGCENDPEYLRLRRSAEDGSMRDTYLAAARLCECQLQAGGCGSNRTALHELIRNYRQQAAELSSNAPAVRR